MNSCLDKIHKGQEIKLLSYGSAPQMYRRRLLAMGLTCGLVVTIAHIAPLGDPITLKIRGVMIVLRRAEMKDLIWECL